MRDATAITLNDRRYRRPRRPTVVVCVDGFDPAYLDDGIDSGVLPALGGFRDTGFAASADAVMPTFTNPNNLSIVTGAAPAVHGISGNYYLDRASGREIMVTDASLMRSETILGKLSQIGVGTAAVTAKDKLRKALGYKMRGICFSAELADGCSVAEHGIEDAEALVGRGKPDRYSGDLSLFVMDAGIRLLEEQRAELIYLSLSDYVQHKHAPGTPESDDFHRALDARIGRLVALGATVAVTADHGMSDKSGPDGAPNVIYLEDILDAEFGPGTARVICPITDPFVRHHGALGSFVRVYVNGGPSIQVLIDYARSLPGIELVLDREAACARFGLPADREGDIVAIGQADTVIGSRRADHDLSGLDGHRLRSHGGLSEQEVPFLLSRSVTADYRVEAESRRLRNFDIFDFALNGVD
ncbi:MAG: phosphonoacetate hydrolase [Kiloniellales bacterium]|nr:phosphonoacetate hydrolase [Kiloniellales bacterium]